MACSVSSGRLSYIISTQTAKTPTTKAINTLTENRYTTNCVEDTVISHLTPKFERNTPS